MRVVHRIVVVVLWGLILALGPYYYLYNEQLVIPEIMLAAVVLFLAPILTLALVLLEFDDRDPED